MAKTSDKYSNTAITERILASRKYRGLYRPTVERTVKLMSERHPPKQVEQKARQKLHQMWGAFVTNIKYDKVLKTVRNDIEAGKDDKTILREVMKLHTSTKERLPDLETFYTKIFEITGRPESIVEYGCGMNPLSHPWMGEGIKYIGYEIDVELVEFCSNVLNECKISRHSNTHPGDV